MAKKTKKSTTAKARQNALNRQRFLDRLPGTEKEHLELMLKFTERAIGPTKNADMIAQAARIRSKIAELG